MERPSPATSWLKDASQPDDATLVLLERPTWFLRLFQDADENYVIASALHPKNLQYRPNELCSLRHDFFEALRVFCASGIAS